MAQFEFFFLWEASEGSADETTRVDGGWYEVKKQAKAERVPVVGDQVYVAAVKTSTGFVPQLTVTEVSFELSSVRSYDIVVILENSSDSELTREALEEWGWTIGESPMEPGIVYPLDHA